MTIRLKPSDRVHLISEVGRAVQAAMKVADIPGYLGAFGIEITISEPVSSKWVLIREVLAGKPDNTVVAIARDLGVPVPGETSRSSAALADLLSEQGLLVCQEDFNRALDTVGSDPAEAIGHASSSLESICKAILHARSVGLPKDESLQSLMRSVSEVLELSPEAHADADLKRLLGGLSNAVAGVAILRTKYSAFHGKSPQQRRLVGRHARLAVNAASAVGLFLIETHFARGGASKGDSMLATA